MSRVASEAAAREEPRIPLSRERVLAAAIRLADASGFESLTMRRLAQELGVEAMTLYYYVSNKDDLLDGMVQIMESEIELPSSGRSWKAELRRTALSVHEIIGRHPWAATLMLSSPTVGQPRMAYMNSMLGCLRGAGFTAQQTDHAYHALESHIMGYSLWVAGMNLGSRDELVAKASDFLDELPADTYPYLVEHVHQHLQPPDPDDEGSFAFGLDLILDGLERHLKRRGPPRAVNR